MSTGTFDPARFRQVLGHYPTGVVVVTAIDDGKPAGLAVGSFSSVSLTPPLVGFYVDRSSSSWPHIQRARRFCVNILHEDQADVCRAFAQKGGDKFAGVRWSPRPTGAPLLDGALAWADCDLEEVHEAGDHLLVLGRVVDLDVGRGGGPLVFFRGGFGRFDPT